ncbi:hypothetical protein SAMN04489724_1895 [Algoriphagus locisalis]|uniref:Uncharacterized protein n=1 Tax=Algoriphagus locisalis TaxID=305507 RepID=A0A1I7AE53_9BACT|nr:hypothetical protein [Algoriphagus locisalis]SFT73236.1 hypothetical protein SAMN04489724_1895 [Algoriphagus locisalis]
MWKLILIIPFWFLPQPPTPDFVVLIVNNCQLAKYVERGENPKRFFIVLDYRDTRGLVTLGHDYIYPEDKPSTMTMSYREILQGNPMFTSDINNLLSWAKLKTNKKKIFILLSSDYCSGKRFVSSQSFTLYEVKIGLELIE